MPNNENDLELALQDIVEAEDIPEREADLNSTLYVSKTKGKIIKSERKFGVEFEVNLGIDGQQNLRKLLDREFGMVHDGSVNNGIEIVSPILGGAKGERQVIKTCKALKTVEAATDDSCGMHVHNDAADFFSKASIQVVPLANALRYAVSKEYKGYRFVQLHGTVLKELKAYNAQLYDTLVNRRTLDAFTFAAWEEFVATLQSYNQIFSGNYETGRNQFILVVPRNARGTRLAINPKVKNGEDIKGYRGETCMIQPEQGYNHLVLVDAGYSAEDLTVIINVGETQAESASTARLKRVAAFYVAFDDVIASMLPCDRRDNDFSKRINVRMSINDIGRCENVLDFFNLWTKTKTLYEFQQSLREQRHESRYSGINFRSLIKHGTIEIRYHSGTIRADKTLYWVALHQRIIDIASDLNNPRFNLERLEKAAMIVDMEAKTNLFFSKLGLEDDCEEYLIKRIEKFKGQDSNFVDSLIADDQ